MEPRATPEGFTCLPLLLATVGSGALLFTVLCTGSLTLLCSGTFTPPAVAGP